MAPSPTVLRGATGAHDGIDRRSFLRSLAAGAVVSTSLAACSSGVVTGAQPGGAPSPKSADGLFLAARRHGVLFGCGVNLDTLRQPDLLAAHAVESGLVVPMGLGPWRVTHPGPEVWEFRVLDAMWDWASSAGLPMRGVHLLWHQNMPDWFGQVVTSDNAEQYLRAHITALMTRYHGRFHSWNPVNEAVFPSDGRADGLRHSPWLQLMGPEYIAKAFAIAAEVDPSATLVYNEFGIEDDTGAADLKRRHTLELLTNLRRQGIPVHALGIQAHVGVSYTFRADTLRAFMDAVADLGLQVYITELDVKDQLAPADIAARDAAVAAKYREFLDLMLGHPAVTTVMTWGLSDRITWLSRQAPRADGLAVRPLPLDAQLQRKPAWAAIREALEGR
ncbi:MAG: endo-1,4-beta-xylanase [Gemmatimonadaceae bacterium]